jgi:Family of unknown function (DUF6289)
MTKLNPTFSLRAALLSFALLLASFAMVSRPAEAVPVACKGTPGFTVYYSDATRKTIVGSYFSGCQGGCNGSGQITNYYRFDHAICTD